MNPRSERPVPVEIVEATAAAWLSLRDRGMSSAETAAFLRWLQQDPRHAEIFGELDRTWKNLDRLAAASTRRRDDVQASPARRFRIGWIALGAAAALVLAFVGVRSSRSARQTVETEVGAFRKVDLPDGSVAQLNTDSALEIDYTTTERRVKVVRGEIFFSVAKDPAHPFLVSAGPIVVRAVGTAFDVRHRTDAVEVLVTEGQVRVDDRVRVASVLPPSATAEPPLLKAGERAIVALDLDHSSAGPAPTVASVERVGAPAVQHALAWQERRLEFDAVPLGEVAREFNRYNRSQLVIDDAALAARRFSGVFRADGYEAFVRLLEIDFGVTVERRGQDLELHARR
jgi:transmembrane sensor